MSGLEWKRDSQGDLLLRKGVGSLLIICVVVEIAYD